jgi:hypothetical protein
MAQGDSGIRNGAPRSSSRTFITKMLLVDRVQNKWAKSILGTISTTVILSFLTLVATTLYHEARQFLSEIQNISQEEALAVARQNIGADTVDAIPFRNIDSDQQYIAVITKTPDDERPGCVPPVWTVHLLEGTEGMYHEVPDLRMKACDFKGVPNVDYSTYEGNHFPEWYRKKLFSVIDVDDDGNKEVHSVVREGGMGSGYTFRVDVYSSLERRHYWLAAVGEFSSPMLTYDTSTNLAQNSKVAGWMQEKARNLTFNKPVGKTTTPDEQERLYKEAVEEWLRANGRGFYEGKVDVREHPGDIPSLGSTVACSVDDEGFRWLSYFKGALFGYDESRHTYFVVYVPYSEYGWVDRMVAGKRYLWLEVGTNDGILAFDKESRALKIVPVPELSNFVKETTSQSGETYPIRLHDEDYRGLNVSDGSLRLGNTRLTLPAYIKTEEELAGATVCNAGYHI